MLLKKECHSCWNTPLALFFSFISHLVCKKLVVYWVSIFFDSSMKISITWKNTYLFPMTGVIFTLIQLSKIRVVKIWLQYLGMVQRICIKAALKYACLLRVWIGARTSIRVPGCPSVLSTILRSTLVSIASRSCLCARAVNTSSKTYKTQAKQKKKLRLAFTPNSTFLTYTLQVMILKWIMNRLTLIT